jgi:hypothetical protein
MTGNSRLGPPKAIARTVPIYGFMFFLGPVVWQLWIDLPPVSSPVSIGKLPAFSS